MIRIIDEFLTEKEYDELGTTSLTFSEIQWVGRYAQPENALHNFVHKIFDTFWPEGSNTIAGATSWGNIRPTNPKPHNDLTSYCTAGGVDYTPEKPPENTFIYYLRAPDKGGNLNIYTKPPTTNVKIGDQELFSWADHETDSIATIENRLISFPMNVTHAVQPYEGNRVSIGAIFWYELPSIYGTTDAYINTSYERPWEKKENKKGTRSLTEKSILGEKY